MLVWWGTRVECMSALARREREGATDDRILVEAFRRLQEFEIRWQEIDPSDVVRETATRFVRVHPLRAADALQLAAAFVAAEQRPGSLNVVTLDDRLADAARKEGFAVIDLAAE